MNTKHLTMAISGLALFGAIHGTAQATIIINDNFSNGSLGTNTGAGAVGTGSSVWGSTQPASPAAMR